MANLIPVVCGIIMDGDKFLVAQRSETMTLPLCWEFPGGKIEADESETECLKRELMEELNLEVSIISKLTPVIHDYTGFSIKLIPYVVNYEGGDIIPSEHNCVDWFDISELNKLNWAPADIPILQQVLSFKRYSK